MNDDQTTVRIERDALKKLKQIAKKTTRSVPLALSVIIDAELTRLDDKEV